MLIAMSRDGSSDFDALGLLHRGAKIKKPRRDLLQQDIKPSWFLVSIKKPRKLRDLLASTLRGLINRVLINKMHSCCQAENLIDDDDQIEKLYTDFGHEGTGVSKTFVFVAFILGKDRGKKKRLF